MNELRFSTHFGLVLLELHMNAIASEYPVWFENKDLGNKYDQRKQAVRDQPVANSMTAQPGRGDEDHLAGRQCRQGTTRWLTEWLQP